MEIIKGKLMENFKMTDGGKAQHFLGIKLENTEEGIKLSQEAYINKMLSKFGLESANTAPSPMTSQANHEDKAEQDTDPETTKNYQELIGSLLYLSETTRPDIKYAVTALAQGMVSPSNAEITGAKRVLRYLKGTKEYHLLLSKQNTGGLKIFCDSDWAGNTWKDRKSTTGLLVEYNGSTISWKTKKQQAHALSSAEAEYYAAATGLKELLFWKKLLMEMKIKNGKPIIVSDSKSAIDMVKQTKETKRSKHIDLQYHFLKEHFEQGTFDLEFVTTDNQKADGLTKPLQGKLLQKSLDQFHIKGACWNDGN
jgi:ribonuclease HI